MEVSLPFPPSSLSGHNKGHWRMKAALVKNHRHWAYLAARAEKHESHDGKGDIDLRIDFYPPDNRGDRVNFPNRMKPYIDGVAEALGINDKRFLPSYHFHAPDYPGRVVITL